MYIGNIHSASAASRTANAAKNEPVAAEKGKGVAGGQGSGADSVTISDDARRVAEAERTLTQPLDDSVPGTYPLEMYAIPEWRTTYYPQGNSELGSSANWMAENYPKLAAATKEERAEYYSRLEKHYQSLLDDHGIDSVPEHYNAMIVDKASSEALRQEYEARVNGDEQLVSLMRKLGMGPFRG